MQYSYLKTLKKVVKYIVLVAIPFIATNYPDVLNLTIGAILIGLLDWAKHSLKLNALRNI